MAVLNDKGEVKQLDEVEVTVDADGESASSTVMDLPKEQKAFERTFTTERGDGGDRVAKALGVGGTSPLDDPRDSDDHVLTTMATHRAEVASLRSAHEKLVQEHQAALADIVHLRQANERALAANEEHRRNLESLRGQRGEAPVNPTTGMSATTAPGGWPLAVDRRLAGLERSISAMETVSDQDNDALARRVAKLEKDLARRPVPTILARTVQKSKAKPKVKAKKKR